MASVDVQVIAQIEVDSKGLFSLPESLVKELLVDGKDGFWLLATAAGDFFMSHGHDAVVREKIDDADVAKARLKALQKTGHLMQATEAGEYELPGSLWERLAGKTLGGEPGNNSGVFRIKS